PGRQRAQHHPLPPGLIGHKGRPLSGDPPPHGAPSVSSATGIPFRLRDSRRTRCEKDPGKASGQQPTSGGAVVAIGSRKRRRDEPVAIPSAEDAHREAVIARLFDGVLRSARSQLLRAESPLAAEVWGSGLMSVWESLPTAPGDGGPFSSGARDTPASFAEALVRHAAQLGTAEG